VAPTRSSGWSGFAPFEERWARARMVIFLFAFLIPGGALSATPGLANAAAREMSAPPPASWSLLAGYGTSHPGLGETKIRVETIELIARHERILTKNRGSSWYQGDHSLLLELPVHLMLSPDSGAMVGLNFLANWTFTAADTLRPYIFAGGGPLYIATEIQGMGTRLNGNYQFGTGLRYRTGAGRSLNFEYRFHHVSNAGRRKPNEPLNSSKLLVGITF
jgi:lipid A 3-O-deacylase